MRFVEAVLGEGFEHLEDLLRMLGITSELFGSGHELDLLLCQLLNLLLTHDTAEDVGLTERVSRYDLGNLHYLLLIDDYPVGGLQDRFELRVRIFDLLQSVLTCDVTVDVLHRARAVECVQCDQILYVVGLCVLEDLLHACRFKLEDTRTVTPLEHVEGVFIKLIDFVDVKVRILLVDEVNRMLDERKGLQPQEVHLYQAALLDLVHGVLGSDGVGLGIVA